MYAMMPMGGVQRVAKGFFYGSVLLLWFVFLIVVRKKPIMLHHLFLWLIYSLYSLCYEVLFGGVLKLYHYISPGESLWYILLGSLLCYPLQAVLYALFFPKNMALWYTAGWLAFMQAFELASLYTGTIVMTGWRILPWSPVTYLFSFLFVYLLEKALKKAVNDRPLLKKA